jgi:spermidine/putrescine-binding protein
MMLSGDIEILQRYSIKIKYKENNEEFSFHYQFPKMSFLGVLYLFIIIPESLKNKELSSKLIDEYLSTKLEMINDAMIKMGLLGLVRNKFRLIKKSDNETFYYFKFVPDFLNFFDYIKILVWFFLIYQLIINVNQLINIL